MKPTLASIRALALGLILFPVVSNATVIHHQVRPGETLQTISSRYFNTTRKWYSIYKQNKNVLATPNSLEPGMNLEFEGQAIASAAEAAEMQGPSAPTTSLAKSEASAASTVPARKPSSLEQRKNSPNAHAEDAAPVRISPQTTPANVEPGAPIIQPAYIKKTQPSESKNDSKEDSQFDEAITQTLARVIESSQNIQPAEKPRPTPQRKIASSRQEQYSAIDSNDTADVSGLDTSVDEPGTPQIAGKIIPQSSLKQVTYQFGRHKLLGPEL